MTRTRLALEDLAARIVPATLLDLTTPGAVAVAPSGAVVEQVDAQPTGTGYIRSFVRIQGAANGGGSQQGFNTDGRPLSFDENKSPQFTRSITLGQVPVVTVNGTAYREFLLDINQKASSPYLSLDQVRVYLGTTGSVTSLAQLGNPVFDLDAGGDVTVKLDARLNSGSGSGDMRLLIPDAAFAGAGPGSFLYLYSKFGGLAGATANGGFEEWAVRAVPPTSPPESPPPTSPPPAPLPESPPSTSPPPTPPPTGSISGRVFLDNNQNGILEEDDGDFGLSNIRIELRLTTADGLTTTIGFFDTDENGFFTFTGLAAGTYTIIAAQSTEYADGAEYVGTAGGQSYSQDFETEDGDYHQDWFVLDLGEGVHAENYFFTEQEKRPGSEG
jgi:hypothetical protein